MKELRSLVLAGSITAALAVSQTVCLAKDSDGKPVRTVTAGTSEPSAEELKNSKERGFIYVDPNPAARSTPVQPQHQPTKPSKPKAAPKAAITAPVKSTVKPKAVRKETQTASRKPKVVAPEVITAQTKPSNAIQMVSHSILPSAAAAQEMFFDVKLNKTGHTYKDGEKLEIKVKANQDCNIFIFNFDSKGKLSQIFPNKYQQACAVKAGDTVTVGGQGSPFDYQVSLPQGKDKAQERIFVYAYPTAESSPVTIAMGLDGASPFRSKEMTVEEYREFVLRTRVFNPREIKVMPKPGAQEVTTRELPINANKAELAITIEK